MTGLLSAISGQFTKAWILGALFPAAVFVILYLLFVAPLLPPELALVAPRVFGTDWNALSVSFATLVLAGLLYNLDTPLIQLYEGYPWQRSVLGMLKTRAHQKRLDVLHRRASVLFDLTADPDTPDRGRLSDIRSDTRRALREDFPDDRDLVLPTRLGNILRAFERYPSVQYGMDAIYFWPRLIGVIPEKYAAALGDARTSLVFLITLSFLTTVLGVLTLAAGLTYLPPNPIPHVFVPAVAAFVVSRWLYALSFGAAADWGHLVKGAFDLYRWELLTQLGYEQKPRTRGDERGLWSLIGLQTIFGDEQTARDEGHPRVDYSEPSSALPATSVEAFPQGVRIELARGVENAGGQRKLRVTVEIRNTDPAKRGASRVVVKEAVPEGLDYRWGSARVDGRTAKVTGIGPYDFDVGRVAAGKSSVLTYVLCRTHNVRRS